MEDLKELNSLRLRLETAEQKLQTEVYLLGDQSKIETLRKCKKHRKSTEKLIFALIQNS